nr:FAD-dependent thymidylate synthase [Blautia argi]
MDDLMALYQKSFTDKTVDRIASLPHPTVQKFTVITVAIVGASRRFLAQITRHQNEVNFMSASLQYSNYSEKAAFAIPYEILFSEQRYIDLYLQSCLSDLRCYQELCSVGFHHDSAGYALPHALRNILIICATPYEWKHMISQRICRRNTDETRIVMLDILFNLKYYKQYSLSNIILHLSICPQCFPSCTTWRWCSWMLSSLSW